MERKVFAIGYNKTGTTSLHRLFQKLGLRSYHGKEWRPCKDLKLLQSYDCFSDGRPHNLPRLNELFPEAKYIWQVRDLEGWIYSRLAHIERRKKKNKYSRQEYFNDDVKSVIHWIIKRNEYHLFLYKYFKNRESDVLLVNIVRDKNAAKKIIRFLGFDENFDMPVENVNPQKEVPEKHKELLQESMNILKIPSSELKFDVYCPSLERRSVVKKYAFDTNLK